MKGDISNVVSYAWNGHFNDAGDERNFRYARRTLILRQLCWTVLAGGGLFALAIIYDYEAFAGDPLFTLLSGLRLGAIVFALILVFMSRRAGSVSSPRLRPLGTVVRNLYRYGFPCRSVDSWRECVFSYHECPGDRAGSLSFPADSK